MQPPACCAHSVETYDKTEAPHEVLAVAEAVCACAATGTVTIDSAIKALVILRKDVIFPPRELYTKRHDNADGPNSGSITSKKRSDSFASKLKIGPTLSVSVRKVNSCNAIFM